MSAGQVETGIELGCRGQAGLLARKDVLFCWIYAVLITAAEVVVGYGNIVVGVGIHAGLLVAVLAHSAFAGRQESSKMILTLVLAPLTRIMSLSMPLGGIPVYYWYAIIGTPLIVATVILARANGYKASDLGVAIPKLSMIPGQLLFALVGIVLGYIEYSILKPHPIISPLTLGGILLPAVILTIFTGFMEEFAFRGVMHKAFTDGVSARFSLIFVSYIFAVLHITHLHVLDIFFVFAVALLFTFAFNRFRNLLGITLAHGMTNIFLYIVWPNIL